jgi:hypothetical protein
MQCKEPLQTIKNWKKVFFFGNFKFFENMSHIYQRNIKISKKKNAFLPVWTLGMISLNFNSLRNDLSQKKFSVKTEPCEQTAKY